MTLTIENDELGDGTIDAGAFVADAAEAADQAETTLPAAAALDEEGEEADDGDAGELRSLGAGWAGAASGKPANARSVARSTGVDIGWSSSGIGTRPAPRRPLLTSARRANAFHALRTRGEAAALPIWPVSGLATHRIRLPTHLAAQWHWNNFAPPSWRCASLTVAGAAQVGSVLADLAPCFPFNCAHRAERASTKCGQV
jgi:hypothetical protein